MAWRLLGMVRRYAIMPRDPQSQEIICTEERVPERGKYAFAVNYRGTRRNAVLIRFEGEIYGYLNQCVHMPKALDIEQSHIFDESGRYLQCSMHKICYEPKTGESVSELCAGRSLTALKVREQAGAVYLVEKKTFLIRS
jgi:nitrite reductase/ring-hydroxylating ferredoxin subunit